MKEQQVQLINLFPTLIYKTKLDHSFSKNENNYIKLIETKYLQKNVGNFSSTFSDKGSYVLNHKFFKKLKEKILFYINDYICNVCAFDKVKPYITQSWLNYTNKNQYHHLHNHQNSYLSGVLYLKASDKDTITFNKGFHNQIRPEVKEDNIYNGDIVHVEGYNDAFKVTTYDNNVIRYLPYI